MSQVVLHAPAIDCAGCVVGIRMAVSQLSGVISVQGSAREKTITVDFDSLKLTTDDIRHAMEDIGYPVTVASPS